MSDGIDGEIGHHHPKLPGVAIDVKVRLALEVEHDSALFKLRFEMLENLLDQLAGVGVASVSVGKDVVTEGFFAERRIDLQLHGTPTSIAAFIGKIMNGSHA